MTRSTASLFMPILVLVAIAACQAAQVCFPNQFKTDQATFDPANHDVFGSRLWFDFYAKKMRLDVDVIIVDNNDTHNRVSIIADYAKEKLYHIFYHDKTGNCTIFPMKDPIERPCLSKNAKHRGTVLMGGVLTAENYIEIDDKKNVVVDILFVDNINVPLRAARRHKDGSQSYDEYWNFEEKAHHDAFVIPSICQQEAVYARDEVSIQELVPQVKSMAFFQ